MKKNNKTPKISDFIYIKPWEGCQYGLSRVLNDNGKLIVEGMCFNEYNEPMQFTLNFNKPEFYDWKFVK